MRSLKYFKKRKKGLFDVNTGIIDLQYNVDLTINDFYPIGGINNAIVFNGLPTSPIGLTEGSVCRDGEGILRIV